MFVQNRDNLKQSKKKNIFIKFIFQSIQHRWMKSEKINKIIFSNYYQR
jgi:hypothetical protein